jgi:hypothetical protein
MKMEIASQLYQEQSQYTYFLLAVAASAVALAIQRTTGTHLTLHHIPLGLAVISWGLSFFAGCRNRGYSSTTLFANIALLQLSEGNHPDQPSHPQAVRAAYEGVRQAAEGNSTSANFWGKLQFRLLVVGALCFIWWHISEMAVAPAMPPTGLNAPGMPAQGS